MVKEAVRAAVGAVPAELAREARARVATARAGMAREGMQQAETSVREGTQQAETSARAAARPVEPVGLRWEPAAQVAAPPAERSVLAGWPEEAAGEPAAPLERLGGLGPAGPAGR